MRIRMPRESVPLQAAVEALIAQEVANGIAPDNIILAGFSQGGAIVLHTALRQADAAWRGAGALHVFAIGGKRPG